MIKRSRFVYPLVFKPDDNFSDANSPKFLKDIGTSQVFLLQDLEKGTIYKAYKPVGMLGKYLGVVPLSGLYEGLWSTSKFWRFFLDKFLPVMTLAIQLFSAFNIMQLLIYCFRTQHQPIIYMFMMLIVNCNFLTHAPICAIVLFFRAKLIIKYLKAHSHVEVLLKSRRKQIVHVAYALLTAAIASFLLKTPCWISMLRLHIIEFNVDVTEIYNPAFVDIAVGLFCVSTFIMIIAECQPEATYILFHYVLKVGFDELTNAIRHDTIIKEEIVCTADKIRYYRKLYQHLLDLAVALNDIISPTILFSFLVNGVVGIVGLYTVIDALSRGFLDPGLFFALSVIIMVAFGMVAVICLSADATIKAASNVLPAIFSSVKLDSFEAKEEAKLFALQGSVKEIKFTASGFFPINRSMLSNIIGAIATYVIIIVQFNTSMK